MARDQAGVPSLTRKMNVPKSMPMTWPLTFSSPPVGPVEAYRARNEVVGDRMFENLEIGGRGSYEEKSVDQAPEWQQVLDVQLLTAETQSYWRRVLDGSGSKMNVKGCVSRGGCR